MLKGRILPHMLSICPFSRDVPRSEGELPKDLNCSKLVVLSIIFIVLFSIHAGLFFIMPNLFFFT